MTRADFFKVIIVAILGQKYGGPLIKKLWPEPAPAFNWDPVLISLVRKSMPNLIAYDVCGVQPMSGPTGLIFAMKSRYEGKAPSGKSNCATYGSGNWCRTLELNRRMKPVEWLPDYQRFSNQIGYPA